MSARLVSPKTALTRQARALLALAARAAAYGPTPLASAVDDAHRTYRGTELRAKPLPGVALTVQLLTYGRGTCTLQLGGRAPLTGSPTDPAFARAVEQAYVAWGFGRGTPVADRPSFEVREAGTGLVLASCDADGRLRLPSEHRCYLHWPSLADLLEAIKNVD